MKVWNRYDRKMLEDKLKSFRNNWSTYYVEKLYEEQEKEKNKEAEVLKDNEESQSQESEDWEVS